MPASSFRIPSSWIVPSLVALAVAIGACTGAVGSGETSLNPDGGRDAGEDAPILDPTAPQNHGGLTSLVVTPPTATVIVKNGDLSGGSTQYTATASFKDGTVQTIGNCVWTIDRIDLGAMHGDGSFTATGNAGGSGSVTCATLGTKATAAVTVLLTDAVDASSGLDDAAKQALLSATTADPAVTNLLYPYDQTVFPRGLKAPELMWNAPAASDVYAVRFAEPGMDFTSFGTVGTPARVTIPQAEWTKLLDTNKGAPLTVSVFRLSGGMAFKSTSQRWTIAPANLEGTIYYWTINRGKVVRIKPGADAPEDFLQLSTGHTCVACHSVSHDGSTLVGAYDGGASPWASFDPKSGAESYNSGVPSGFEAVYPDGSLVVNGQSQGGTVVLSDGKTGASLEPSGLAAFGNVVHPSFSADGKWLVFGARNDGNWLDFTNSDLALAPFDLATHQFGAMKTLRPSGGHALTYPSFTPDGDWIAYQDGPQSRTRGIQADLHFIKSDGSSDVVLDAAGNGGVSSADHSLNFEPTFNPVLSGGYFWLVFVSSRTYGNRLTQTNDASCAADLSNCRTKQLWVTAIEANPKPGTDPSHPAFWLPGQDNADQNMRGYWALDVCKKLGEGCTAGFECCDGACKDDGSGSGTKICSTTPPGACGNVGDKCASDADCCNTSDGVSCVGGICAQKKPK